MDHHRVYCQLMLSARSKGRKSLAKSDPDYIYYEEHHILPSSMGGADQPQNLVLLTPREHFIAHWLLPKFTNGCDRVKMLHALVAMSMDKARRKLTSRQYAVCAKARSVVMQTESVFVKCSDAVRAGRARYCAEISAANRHNFQSDEFRTYKSDFQKQIVHCHCGKTGQRGGMAKAHGRNCKVKPQLALNLQLTGLQPGSRLDVKSDMAILKAEMRRLEAEELAATAHARQLKVKQGKSQRAKIQVTCSWCNKTGNKLPMHAYHFDNSLDHLDNAGLTRAQIRAKFN